MPQVKQGVGMAEGWGISGLGECVVRWDEILVAWWSGSIALGWICLLLQVEGKFKFLLNHQA